MGAPRKILSIAGSDSGGGAGIQADLKTITALGCYGLTAITALTAQNTQGVRAIHAPEPSFLESQLSAVLDDIGADAVKIGMLHSPEIVDVVARLLTAYGCSNIVLDPVMIATSGDLLITPKTQEEIVRRLFPMAAVVTPNLDELSLLVGEPITRPNQFEAAARKILSMGCSAVLIKGGHLDQPQLVDVLFERVERPTSENTLLNPSALQVTEITNPRINTRNLHGTGCTLSSAIACFLAQGYPLRNAVKGGQDYVYRAIASAVTMRIDQAWNSNPQASTHAKGHGPINHGFAPQPMTLSGD